MNYPASIYALFSTLDYLDRVPLRVIERWSPSEQEAAERWAHAWELWISDVSDHPLPEPPSVLRPYLPVDFR